MMTFWIIFWLQSSKLGWADMGIAKVPNLLTPRLGCVKNKRDLDKRGRDKEEKRWGHESNQKRVESQWTMIARSLCHLQYLIAYLSYYRRFYLLFSENYTSLFRMELDYKSICQIMFGTFILIDPHLFSKHKNKLFHFNLCSI